MAITTLEQLTKTANNVLFPADTVQKAYDLMLSDVRSRLPAKITKAVTGVYSIKQSEVREEGASAQKTAQITKGKTSGSIRMDGLTMTYQGRRLTLAHFKLYPGGKPTKKKYKVKATIFKGKRVTINGKGTPPFVAPTSRKDAGATWIAFTRLGKERLPIAPIRTVSIPQMMENETVAGVINTEKDKLVLDRFQHHLDRLTKSEKPSVIKGIGLKTS